MSYIGTVLRSHAGGYLVHVQTEQNSELLLTCQARGRLKKERVAIVTGDLVEIDELDEATNSAVIVAQLARRSLVRKPPLANVDQVVIVQAVKQPDFSHLWCDRYLVHFQLALPVSRPILCFNKCDLAEHFELEGLRSIYEPLGYFVIFTSARTGAGVAELARSISGKISVFAGPSGVGKSSILNELSPGLKLKTGVMENSFGVGRHTTTASELYRLKLKGDDDAVLTWLADTPGFNLYEFLHPEPRDVIAQFPEVLALSDKCKYANCLHLVEDGCAVLAALAGSKGISAERYLSYQTLVAESQAEAQAAKSISKKVESSVKTVGGEGKSKVIPRLSHRYREASRRKEKQKVTDFDDDEDEEGEFVDVFQSEPDDDYSDTED